MSGETIGGVRIVLRLEGLLVLIAAGVAYSKFGLGWGTFALWFLAPDLSFFGFLAGPKVGSIAYNLAHSYIGAICCIKAHHAPIQCRIVEQEIKMSIGDDAVEAHAPLQSCCEASN